MITALQATALCDNAVKIWRMTIRIPVCPVGPPHIMGRSLIRAETAFDLVACAFDAAWVSALDAELERRPDGALRVQVNVEDPAAQQLLTLLMAEAHEGCTTERLYTESLAQALAVRMLFLGSRTQA